MSVFEGGPFKCLKDDFTTTDVNEWNEHCSQPEGDSTHITESGVTPCAICKEELSIDGFPFVSFDNQGRKTYTIICEDCQSKQKGATIRKVKK